VEERAKQDCQIRLKNLSGVPVIEVVGIINAASLRALEKMILALERAGHYNIVLNLRRALTGNIELFTSLAKCVGRIRGHYGNIDLVVEAAQIKQMANNGLARLFRFCTSESQAFGRIKRLLRPPDEAAVITSARIMEPEWPNEKAN